VEQLEVELPETLIQEEIRALIEQTAGQIAQQGMDVKKLFTPDLVRSLMDTSRPEAEQRLRRNLALRALASSESITVDSQALEARIREVSRDLNERSRVDPARLRSAVEDDLLREALLTWLEDNSSITEKAASQEASGEATAQPAVAAEADAEAPRPGARQDSVKPETQSEGKPEGKAKPPQPAAG
jgi:trigger factor